MIASASCQRSPARPLAAFLVVSAAFLLFFNLDPAQAQSQAFGTVVVERGQVVPEVSTSVGNVEVLGEVEGRVRCASGDVLVDGPVGGNVRVGVGNIEVREPVGGRVKAGFGNVYIDSRVDGDVIVEHGNIELGPSANIEGRVYHGSGQFSADDDASFGGAMAGMASDFGRETDASDLLGFIGWFFVAALFAAITVLASVLMPRPLGAAARKVGETPVWSLLAGFASVIAALVAFTLLLVSGVGIPLLVLLAPLYLAFVFFGAVVVAFFIGRKVVLATGRYRSGNTLAAVVGALILALVYFLPLGFFLFCVLALFGAGATLMAIFAGRYSRDYYAPFSGRRD